MDGHHGTLPRPTHDGFGIFSYNGRRLCRKVEPTTFEPEERADVT